LRGTILWVFVLSIIYPRFETAKIGSSGYKTVSPTVHVWFSLPNSG
jgi:hypothetical protein